MTDVVCPAGKGTLSTDACLACALTWENLCGYDYGILKAMYEKAVRTGIHVTDLTGCLRKSWFSRTISMPVSVHSLLVMFSGLALHDSFERSGDDNSFSELDLEWDGVVGRADRLYKDGVLVDYKTTRWMVPSRLPYGSHQLQLQIYAHMLKKMGREVKRAFIQYVDVSGPTKCTSGSKYAKCNTLVILKDGQFVCPKCEKVYPEGHLGAMRVEVDITQDVEQYIIQSRDMLQSAIDNHTQPLPDPGWLCGYCQFNTICDAALGG
jgi:CRISPR/Cas system-associated exonuclease Cas4 (RecB family)